MWFQLHDILEEAKLRRQYKKKDRGEEGTNGVSPEDRQDSQSEFIQWSYSVWNHKDEYISVSICPNPRTSNTKSAFSGNRGLSVITPIIRHSSGQPPWGCVIGGPSSLLPPC